MRSVDVVIATRDTREMTLGCVRSVLAERAADLEVHCAVVDNGSSDGTADALGAAFPEVTVVRNDHNAAYGKACNQGAATGEAEWVLILNSDIVVRPGSIGRLLAYLEAHPDHVAAGGRVVDPGTDRVQIGHSVRAFPGLASQLAQIAGLERGWSGNPITRRAMALDRDYDRSHDVEQPPGSCLAVRRFDFDALGGFDEGFFYWYEDVDLCKRLRARGRIAYVHDAPFEHLGHATFEAWGRPERIVSWYSGVFRYFGKHHSRREQLLIRGVAGAACALRIPPALLTDRSRARALGRVTRLAMSPGPGEGAAAPASIQGRGDTVRERPRKRIR